jgi:hypothetical protein
MMRQVISKQQVTMPAVLAEKLIRQQLQAAQMALECDLLCSFYRKVIGAISSNY